MMPESNKPSGKDRPFPWQCTECGHREIYPLVTDYTTTEIHDGRGYEIRIPDLAIPTCRHCGDRLITTKVDNRLTEALRLRVGLLAPGEIAAIRQELALSPGEMAEELGVSEQLFTDWETGMIVQSRAMDKLLRLYIQVRRSSATSNAAGTEAGKGAELLRI